ncbi:TonB-dependent receptor, partial [Novosphingobium sp. 1949]
QAPAPEPLVGAPIEVIGQRIADRLSIAAKRGARTILDAVASDEVRRLPDASVVDAMRRIPGVSVVPVADNEHPRDVPVAPVVRGLTQAYNNVTIDGQPVASTGIPDAGSNSTSRGVRLDILPASLVSRLDVVKTFTPDRDPNAIGAAIDLHTRSAFDDGARPFVSLEGGLARPSRSGAVQSQPALGGHGALTASRTFGASDQFGLVLSAHYRQLANNSTVHGTSDSGYLVFYDADGNRVEDDGDTGNGIPVPEQDKYWVNSSSRRQWGGSARFEARLDTLHLSLLAGEFHFRDGYIRNEVVIDPKSDTVVDQTATSGHFDAASIQVGYRDGVTRNRTRLVMGEARWEPGARDVVRLSASVSQARMREAYAQVKFTAGLTASGSVKGSSAFPVDYDTSTLQHSFSVPEDSYYDLSLYPLAYWRKRQRRALSDLGTVRLDWSHAMAPGDEGLGFAMGLGVQRSAYRYRYTSRVYKTTDRTITLADAGYVSGVSLPYNREGLKLLVIDPVKAWALLEANADSVYLESDPDDDLADRFTHRETSLSGYALAHFAQGPWELEAGLHLDATRLSTRGYMEVDESWQAAANAARYAPLLPAALVDFDASEALTLRAAYSRTIGRPSYESYSPGSSIEFGTDSTLGDGTSQDVSVSLGNPDLKPRRSDNFDLSAEWRLPTGFDGLFALAAFHKGIRNEIFDAVTSGYTYDGVYYRYAKVTQPTNASGARVSGLEASLTVGSLAPVSRHLTGLGFSANWTRLEGSLDVLTSAGTTRRLGQLVGQPGEIRNLAMFFTQDGFELRGALNWTSTALRAITPDVAYEDVYWAPRRQLDLQARYHFGAGLSVILDVANLTEARLTSVTGPGRAWLKDSYSVPRTVRLSLHWGLGN